MAREEMDRYYTPSPVWDGILADVLAAHGLPRPQRIIDPCVGGGSLQRAAANHGITRHIVGDLDPNAPGLDLGEHAFVGSAIGAMAENAWKRHVDGIPDFGMTSNWLVTNPPYADEDGVGSLLNLHNQLGTQRMVLLLRASILKSLVRSPRLRPLEAFFLESRPVWEGPGGELLLREAQARDRKAGRPVRQKAPTDMVDSVVCVWGWLPDFVKATKLRAQVIP